MNLFSLKGPAESSGNKEMTPKENFELWLAQNEEQIKSAFPSSETHVENLDNVSIRKNLVECGANIETWTDYLHMMRALFHYGFYESTGKYHLIRTSRQLFEMSWEA